MAKDLRIAFWLRFALQSLKAKRHTTQSAGPRLLECQV